MFIQTEQTPNPATLKFIPGEPVVADGSADFRSPDDAAGKSPLAERLFGIDQVTGVFLGPDFITVTKGDAAEWYLLKPAILGVIMEHFTAGQPVLTEGVDLKADDVAGEEIDDDTEEIVSQIKELLETRVRPAVAQDGGDIVFQAFQNGVVYLHMRGACAGCPSSTATLKMGIENMLRHYIPEVTEVRAV
ncbi:MAG: NifU family protein [Rhodospirillales bacterium]|nr:MAG: NifU family protein [Rhodospirillales bacterium]